MFKNIKTMKTKRLNNTLTGYEYFWLCPGRQIVMTRGSVYKTEKLTHISVQQRR